MTRHPVASATRSRPRANRYSRHVFACALAFGSALLAAHAADGAAPSAPRMVQSHGTMMWVLDSPAPASPSAPTVLPVLDTRLIEGRYTRVLRAPVGATMMAPGAMAPRPAPFEQVLPNGARMLTLPTDPIAAPVAYPALVERLIDPRQPGTQPDDFPAPNTLYRLVPPR